jgi:uncharacterized protein YodC (DUF2158 family)
MADDFKAGDVVQQKSGGPKMTIERIDKKFQTSTTNSAFCSWFDDKNKRTQAYFESVSRGQPTLYSIFLSDVSRVNRTRPTPISTRAVDGRLLGASTAKGLIPPCLGNLTVLS